MKQSTWKSGEPNLEAGAVDVPRYLPALARVMGYHSTDELREMRPPPVQTSTLAAEGVAQYLIHPPRSITPTTIAWGDLMQRKLPVEFQTQMPDASMAPEIPMGAQVIFVTSVDARPGDFVLIADGQGHHFIREYRALRPGHWQAHALNTAYLPLDSQRDQLRVLAVFDGVRGRRSIDQPR